MGVDLDQAGQHQAPLKIPPLQVRALCFPCSDEIDPAIAQQQVDRPGAIREPRIGQEPSHASAMAARRWPGFKSPAGSQRRLASK